MQCFDFELPNNFFSLFSFSLNSTIGDGLNFLDNGIQVDVSAYCYVIAGGYFSLRG